MTSKEIDKWLKTARAHPRLHLDTWRGPVTLHGFSWRDLTCYRGHATVDPTDPHSLLYNVYAGAGFKSQTQIKDAVGRPVTIECLWKGCLITLGANWTGGDVTRRLTQHPPTRHGITVEELPELLAWADREFPHFGGVK